MKMAETATAIQRELKILTGAPPGGKKLAGIMPKTPSQI
jgi:hypothetical protein